MTDFLTDYGIIIALACAGAALVYGIMTSRWLLAKSPGNEEMQRISHAVQEGAQAYLKRQYTIIAYVAIVLAVLLAIALDIETAIGFVIGGTLSAAAGFIGMNVSVRANARVAESARGGISPALDLAFKGGAVTGMLVAGLALLGVAGYYGALLIFDVDEKDAVDALVGLGFGGSLISVFARLGGGIFTKAADVGADLVGKVEAGIPEDDPRNPAVIADNVGDNVGDCAGMAADLFETYAVTIVATMVLAAIFFAGQTNVNGVNVLENMLLFPLAIGAACIVTSIIGTFFVKLGQNQSIMGALYKGLIATGVLSIAAIALINFVLFGGFGAQFRTNAGATS
ncbi:MAG TPA: sodium/proton-translocating pyrophosphatase, partial [Thermoleophilaceae bacterium]